MINESIVTIIDDLIASDEQSVGKPSLLQEQRSVFQEYAETKILVNRNARHEYFRYLTSHVSTFRHQDLLSEVEEKQVLENGLGSLSDSGLSRFALNPIAISAVADAVDELLPDYWLTIFEKDGRAMLGPVSLQFTGSPRMLGGPWFTKTIPLETARQRALESTAKLQEQILKQREEDAKLLRDPWESSDDLHDGSA